MIRTALTLFFIFLFSGAQSQSLPWKLTVGTSSEIPCKDCFADSKRFSNEQVFSNGRRGISFSTNDTPFLLQYFLVRGRDGLALVILPEQPYPCTDSAAIGINMEDVKIYRPVYKRKILKQRRKQLGRKAKSLDPPVTVKLTKRLVSAPSSCSYALAYIKNRKICEVRPFVARCAFDAPLPEIDLYPLPISMEPATAPPIQKQIRKRLNVPFEKGKYTFDYADIQPLLDSIQGANRLVIRSIDIAAYTSVEGDSARNMQLAKQRAESIVAALQSVQQDTIAYTLRSTVAWQPFMKSLGTFAGGTYTAWQTYPKDKILNLLRDTTHLHALEPLLARQRVAMLQIKGYLELTPQEQAALYLDSLNKEIKSLHQTIRNLRDNENLPAQALQGIGRAEYLHQLVFGAMLNQLIPAERVAALSLPSHPGLGTLYHQQAAVLIASTSFRGESSTEMYRPLNTLYLQMRRTKTFSAEALYNWVWLRIQYPGIASPLSSDSLLRYADEVYTKNHALRGLSNDLKAHAYYMRLDKEPAERMKLERYEETMRFFEKYHASRTYKQEEAVQIARYFSGLPSGHILSAELLYPFVASGDATAETLRVLIPLADGSNSFYNDDTRYRLLVLAREKMSPAEWCTLFGDEACQLCKTVLGDERIRNLYCETCP